MLLPAYVGAMLGAGIVLAWVFLHLDRVIDCIAVGGMAAISFSVWGVNLLGTIIPLRAASLLLLGMLALGAAAALRHASRTGRKRPRFDMRPGSLALLVLLCAILAGGSLMATLQVFLYDDWAASHAPMSLLMSYDTFPPREPGDPSVPFAYHYASDLLSSMLELVAGIPAWHGYDVQIAMFAALTPMLAFALFRQMAGGHVPTDRLDRFALVATFCAIWGGVATWLLQVGDDETHVIASRFGSEPLGAIAGVVHRMLSIADPAEGRMTSTYIQAMHTHSNAIALPVLLLAVFALLRAIAPDEVRWRRWALIATGASAFLVLAAETVWAVGGLFGLLVAGFESIRRRSRVPIARTISIAAVSTIIAALQGGALFSRGGIETGEPRFTLAPEFGTIAANQHAASVLSWQFAAEWIPALAVAIPAGLWLGVQRRSSAAAAALIAGLAAGSVPIILHYPQAPFELIRMFHPGMFLTMCAAGAGIAALVVQRRSRVGRVSGYGIAATLTASAFLWQIQHALFPIGGVPFDQPGISERHEPIGIPALQRVSHVNALPMVEEDFEDALRLRELPRGARIVSTHPFNAADDGFNVKLSGRFLQLSYIAERLELQQRAAMLDLDAMKELEATHVYMTERDAQAIGIDLGLLDNAQFRMAYRNGPPGDRRWIYEVQDDE